MTQRLSSKGCGRGAEVSKRVRSRCETHQEYVKSLRMNRIRCITILLAVPSFGGQYWLQAWLTCVELTMNASYLRTCTTGVQCHCGMGFSRSFVTNITGNGNFVRRGYPVCLASSAGHLLQRVAGDIFAQSCVQPCSASHLK